MKVIAIEASAPDASGQQTAAEPVCGPGGDSQVLAGVESAAGAHAGAQADPWIRPEWMPDGFEACILPDVEGLLAYPVRLFTELPVGAALICAAPSGASVVITTARAVYEAALEAGAPVFHGGELTAMVIAAEVDRVVPADVARWCDRKLQGRGWTLSARQAIEGFRGRAVPMGWTFGQLFDALGLTLEQVYAAGGRA